MRKIWTSGGLIIAGLIILGGAIDRIANKGNIFNLIGLSLGLLILAIMVLKNKKQ